MIIMDYTDGFPWLKWSRHFRGETSVRMKIIEPYNLMSTILTVALWLGNDDYETVKKCTELVFKQLKDLQSVTHPLSGKEVKIFRRSCEDGKERRSSTGSSSAKSSYPIPEAPEHQSQLGDMKLICPQPVWEVEETVVMEEQFQNTLNDKTGDEYGAQARVLLGFQAVQIFGSTSITASCKQIVMSMELRLESFLVFKQFKYLEVPVSQLLASKL